MSKLNEHFSVKYNFAGNEKKIPIILDAYLQKTADISDVNIVLELHNIKKFFEKYDSVNGWDSEKYKHYSDLANNSRQEVIAFFCSLKADELVSTFDKCDVIFWDDFWILFYQFKVYERIPKSSFAKIMNGMRASPNHILKNKEFILKSIRNIQIYI